MHAPHAPLAARRGALLAALFNLALAPACGSDDGAGGLGGTRPIGGGAGEGSGASDGGASSDPADGGATGGQVDAGGPCESDCGGRQCGLDPACGRSCGLCAAGLTCTSEGRCVGGAGGADGGADGGTTDAGARSDGGPGRDGGTTPDGCFDTLDVVFVLDISSSMTFVLDTLDTGIADVVRAANAISADAHFGLVSFADNAALDTTGALEGGKVHTTAATLQAAFRTIKRVYTLEDRNPGDGPTGRTVQNPICEENALDALHDAAVDFPWREGSTRVVILVTDDTFLERPDNYGDRDGDGDTTSTDFPTEGDYPARWTVPETVEALRDARARVFGFTRVRAPSLLSGRCGTGRRIPWAQIGAGWSIPYGQNAPIPQATGGENFDLDAVRNRRLSLTQTINEVVADSYCKPINL